MTTEPAQRVRVLLVDDDEDERLIVGDLLRSARCGYELAWVSNYDEGLEAILSARFDVCLVDYRLGGRSGLDLLVEARAKSSDAQIILLTGEGDRETDVNATKSGAADYLVKGELSASLLERAVRYAVERGRGVKALREAMQAAESANRAKSQFLETVSHEIRTPMNAILGMSEMLAESSLDAKQMQYVELFQRAGSDLLKLINDILDLSKIEAGQIELEHIDFDLEDVVDHTIELTAVKSRSKGIVLLSHLLPGVSTGLVGDPTRLRQILINLLGNAVKFTESGEIVLTVRTHDAGNPGKIEFAVSDSGIGIPPDKLEAIFNSFTQADAATTRKYGGTGLGLNISRRLVEQMGGHLTVTSQVGKGSSFRFSVQFDLDAQSAGKAAGAKYPPGQCVLVIDSNASRRCIASETLDAWGLESAGFGEPEAALVSLSAAIAGDRSFSLVLLDSGMPGLDAGAIAARIRQISPGLPVIAFTSDVRSGETLCGGHGHGLGYAVLPVSRTELRRLIGCAIGSGEAQKPNLPAGSHRPSIETGKHLRILVAEDSAQIRMLLEVFMDGSGHHLAFAENGQSAVARFASENFDLILMDTQMPVMDGHAATRAIRAIERERGGGSIPVVALTGDALPRDVELGREAGCNYHLSKPISRHALLRVIEEYGQQRNGNPFDLPQGNSLPGRSLAFR